MLSAWHPVSSPRLAASGLENAQSERGKKPFSDWPQSRLGDGLIGPDWNVVSSPDWPGYVLIGLDTCRVGLRTCEVRLGGLGLDWTRLKIHIEGITHRTYKSVAEKPKIPTKNKSLKKKLRACWGCSVNEFSLGVTRRARLRKRHTCRQKVEIG